VKAVIATGNKHKVKEFARILNPLGIETVTPAELGISLDVEEDGTTFEENAFKKAMAFYKAAGMPAFADDSGICVDYLDGAPGIYSARFAGENGGDKANNAKLLSLMEDVPDGQRKAKFVCAICAVFSEKDIIECRGECHGTVAREEHGDNGFGYDPLFMVGDRSFAEISGDEKDSISHRGRALRELNAILCAKGKNK